MIAKKHIFIGSILMLLTFLRCCKKEEGIKKENELNTVSQAEKLGAATLERFDPDTYAKWIDSIKVQVVDIRTKEEFIEEHLENAGNVNVLDSTFIVQMSKYPKDVPIYVYCTAGGKRSVDAAKMLQEEGYNVVNLDGGIIEWKKKGYKVVK